MNQPVAILLLLTIGLQFQSCKEDDNLIITPPSLEGTWEAVSYEASIRDDFYTGGQAVEHRHYVEGFDLDYQITFREGTFTTTGSYWTSDITHWGIDSLLYDNVSITGDYTTTADSLTVDSTLFRLTFENADLSKVSGKQTLGYEISSSGNELIIRQNEEYLNIFDSGASKRVTIYSTSIWKK